MLLNMYATRVRGDGNGCSLSSAKVQIFWQSEVSRSYVERLKAHPRSVNGVGILLTPVNNQLVNTFSRMEGEMLTGCKRSPEKHLTMFNC